MPTAPPILCCDDLGATLSGRRVLDGVSLTLAAGEIVALIGPNGCGKTTLLRATLNYVARDAGRVDWFGRALASWGTRDLARRVAYLPQSPTFDGGERVGDALRLGRAARWRWFGLESDADAAAVRAVAADLELADLLDRPLDALSGGQRQRVFVARSLVQEPSALLLDEPGTYLDWRHQVELNQLLHRLARERQIGVLMASHDLNLAAMVADRMVLLDRGRVVADGPPAAVLSPDVLGRVYEVAMRRIDLPDGTPVVLPAGKTP